jgi:glycine cleavage system H lipoate-binding protein
VEDDILGMSFPPDRFYHRGHTWARPERDGTVTVGLDDLGSRLAGGRAALELPKPGASVHVNGPAFRIRRNGSSVRILSPVNGEVIAANAGEGDWLLKIHPRQSGEKAFCHLLRGAEVRPWLIREMERLQLALTAEGASPALADGGTLVADIAEAYPDADWDAICGQMFLDS